MKQVSDFYFKQMIWVSCKGKTTIDEANAGSITYLPRQGFPGFYYPCTSEESCTEPIVAINFKRPKGEYFDKLFQSIILINFNCSPNID